jgi:superfamily II DNA or RNA helicase
MPAKKLRAYQTEASNAIQAAWAKGQNNIVALATGGGKTLIAAETSARVNSVGRVLFLANRNELIRQPQEVFTERLGFLPGVEQADNFASLDARVVIGSVQTLSRKKRLERFPTDHFDYIFADECHLSLAESWKRIFAHFSSAKRCGITATPFRTDNKSLTDLYEVESYRKGIFDLVDEGYLVNPDHVDRLETAISLAQVRVKRTVEGIDYDVQDAADAIEPYFMEIAKEIMAKHSEKRILAFLPLIASSQKFVRACQAAGLRAIHTDGEDPERDAKLAAFRRGEIQLLSNSALLHTGIDIPACDCTLMLRPTRSKVLYQQVVGRSTRTAPGVIDGLETVEARLAAIAGSSKPRAYILDPMWLTEDHDLVTPMTLIAQTEEEAEDMKAAATGSYSLRGLQIEIQRQREEKIRQRFEATARFREGLVPAELFAAGEGDRLLQNYRAVYAWETLPLKNFTRLLLEKAGIDPETVQSEGYGRAIMLAVGRRRHRRMPEIRALAGAAAAGVEELWKLTLREAERYGH